MKWIQFILDILQKIFGGGSYVEEVKQAGRMEQQRDDAVATVKEEQNAAKNAIDVHDESDVALDAELRGDDPGRK